PRRPAALSCRAMPVSARSRDAMLALLAAGLALWVHRATIGGFFSPDDLIYLERTRGWIAEPPVPWRWLSGHLYFHTAFALFGVHPGPWLAVNWIGHGVVVALLYLFVRSWGGGPLAAFAAAGLFGASRLLVTTLGQAVTFAEISSLGLTLVAL